MAITPLVVARGLWAAWALSWGLAAAWSSRPVARAAPGAELAYRAATVVGVALLFVPGRFLPGDARLWDAPSAVRWAFVALMAAGFAFCWWARLHLGRNWSSSVTRKADHRIVDTGPYALVRHPIYTGLILAALAMAALAAQPTALAGWAVLVLGFWLKARLEERFLRAELGPDAYDAYAKRTGMLFPGL